MARDPRNRRREFELMEQEARYRQEQELRRHREYYEDQWARPNNTLGPDEEVVAKRRRNRRKHVVIQAGGAHTRNVLGENLILLAALVASIYGIYSLCIYILNH
ncbi:MAG: hypothetical protein Q4F38_05755 [Akkermansia sp.]|nr:hypothetical protein [Akkermansia sp.]